MAFKLIEAAQDRWRAVNGPHLVALVWAVLDRASRGWRGLDMNPANVRHLQQLRADLHHHTNRTEQPIDLPEPVTPAA